MTIISDIQKLTPGAVIDLFVLDCTGIGGEELRFHALRTAQSIVWQGETYVPFPIELEGFERSGDRQSPRPTAKVANVTGLISALMKSLDDLLGAKLTRKRTLVKYLDAINSLGGLNSNPDPAQEFADEIWFIDRKASETKFFVTFELTAPWDLEGLQLPRRPCGATICTWKYRSAECSYIGGPVADRNNNPVKILAQDDCSLTVTGCKLRFGPKASLPIGVFPAVGIVR